jgi:hypothetical protein
MIVIFVHGWSVTHTDRYGALPEWLESQAKDKKLDILVGNIYLGRYISFDDTVTVDDIGRCRQMMQIILNDWVLSKVVFHVRLNR